MLISGLILLIFKNISLIFYNEVLYNIVSIK